MATVEEFRRTLVAANSFARNEGADSGIFMAVPIQRLGIAAIMKPKTTLVRAGDACPEMRRFQRNQENTRLPRASGVWSRSGPLKAKIPGRCPGAFDLVAASCVITTCS
jgi:hypothetical protein